VTENQDVPIQDAQRVVSTSREIAATPERIFELIADPAQQPRWDASDNLREAVTGQRVRGAGEVFRMTLTMGSIRENHVVEFEEGRRIAWRPSEVGRRPPGHLWRWELEPVGPGRTLVTHTYDWTELTDQNRLKRAQWTTSDRLSASLDRLAALAEGTS
jgi:uncharacterized protein YndB with AHSA1/START domain